MGSYHLKYYLDGKLIAVSVADILPTAYSSYYFFYDPDYKKFSLGKISIMYEMQFVKNLSKNFPEFKYYYLGWYI